MPAAALPVPVPTRPALTTQPAAARPERRKTGIVGQLNAEWERLAATPRHDREVQLWAQLEPALRPAAALRDIEDLHRADPDEVLAALLRLNGAGAHLAGHAVMFLMQGEAVRLASRTTHHRDGGFADHQGHVLASLWEAIQRYPVDRPAAGGRSRLSLDTLRGVTPQRRGRTPLRVISGDELGAPVSHQSGTWSQNPLEEIPEPDGPAKDAAAIVHDLVRWGAERGHLTTTEAQLVAAYYTRRQDQSSADLAHELDLSPAALRQRVSRITRRLKQAVQQATASSDPALLGLVA